MPDIARFLAAAAATGPAFSKSGRHLWYLSTRGETRQAWRLDLATGERRQMTGFDDNVSMLKAAPAGEDAICGVDHHGDENHQLWRLPGDGTAPVALTALPKVMHGSYAWSPDAQRIAFSANRDAPAPMDIYVQDLAGGEARKIWATGGAYEVAGWHPDRRRVTVVSGPRTEEAHLFLVDAESGAVEPLTGTGAWRHQSPRWSADGATLYCLSDRGRDFLGLAAIDAATRELTFLHAPSFDVEKVALNADQRTFALSVNEAGLSRLVLFDLGSGLAQTVPGLPEGVIGDLAWSPDGASLVVSHSHAREPSDIWLWRRAERRWTKLGLNDLAGLEGLAAPRLIATASFDATLIPSWLYTPAGAPPAGGWPVLIWVHGGPASQALPEFRADLQWCVASGIAVVVPNVRGSTGYGRAYMQADDLDKRLDSVKDLKAVRDAIAAHPDFDAARIGVMGQSYGGYMVLMAASHYPKDWACVVNYYGIWDWMTFFQRTSPYRYEHRAAEYGHPQRDPALLRALSPASRGEAIEAPMLVAHGSPDPRVPIEESEQVVDFLKTRGRPVDYVRFGNEGHGFMRRTNRTIVYGEVARFLGQHLGTATP
ncbi:MAG: S9 family peptidase [Thalassobaculales bacterium]